MDFIEQKRFYAETLESLKAESNHEVPTRSNTPYMEEDFISMESQLESLQQTVFFLGKDCTIPDDSFTKFPQKARTATPDLWHWAFYVGKKTKDVPIYFFSKATFHSKAEAETDWKAFLKQKLLEYLEACHYRDQYVQAFGSDYLQPWPEAYEHDDE